MNEDAILAVKRGAYFMDENYPGWASKINLNRFSMSLCHRCIVGQAIGDYAMIISEASGQILGSVESDDWATSHGFDVDYGRLVSYGYKELETLWTEQVRERLNNR